jgi:hypothetical protein
MASEGVALHEEGEGTVMFSRSSSYDEDYLALGEQNGICEFLCELDPPEDVLNDFGLVHNSLATNQKYYGDLSGQEGGDENITLNESERPSAKNLRVSLKVATIDTLGATSEVDSSETSPKPKRSKSKTGMPRGPYKCGRCGKPMKDEQGRPHLCEILCAKVEKCKVDASTNTPRHRKRPQADLKSTCANNEVIFSNPYNAVFHEHLSATVTDEHSDLIVGAFEDPEWNDQDVYTVSLAFMTYAINHTDERLLSDHPTPVILPPFYRGL